MKERRIELDKLRDALIAECPFIGFAMTNGVSQKGVMEPGMNLEVAVYLSPYPGMMAALEKILPVVDYHSPSSVFYELTLLNRVDTPSSQEMAENGSCLFIRSGFEQTYHEFLVQSRLHYRIYRAHLRRRGMLKEPEPRILPPYQSRGPRDRIN
jgi:hypothetical protein